LLQFPTFEDLFGVGTPRPSMNVFHGPVLVGLIEVQNLMGQRGNLRRGHLRQTALMLMRRALPDRDRRTAAST
jgi:hypothetical protein